MKFKGKKTSIHFSKFVIIFICLLLFLIIFIFYIKNNDNLKFIFSRKNKALEINFSLVVPIKSREFEKIRRNFKIS